MGCIIYGILFVAGIDHNEDDNFINRYLLITMGIPTERPTIKAVLLLLLSSPVVVVTPLVTTLDEVTVNPDAIVGFELRLDASALVAPTVVVPSPTYPSALTTVDP